MSPTGHRRRVRHCDDPGHSHEFTFSCCRGMPLLTKNRWEGMLSRSIDRAAEGDVFLADEDLRGSIVRAVRRLAPAIELRTAVEEGLSGKADEEVLDHSWLLVSHDATP